MNGQALLPGILLPSPVDEDISDVRQSAVDIPSATGSSPDIDPQTGLPVDAPAYDASDPPRLEGGGGDGSTLARTGTPGDAAGRSGDAAGCSGDAAGCSGDAAGGAGQAEGCSGDDSSAEVLPPVPVHELPLMRWLSAAGDLTPEESAPEESAPNKSVSGVLSSGESEHGEAAPEVPAAGDALSGESAPDVSGPDVSGPDESGPGESGPDVSAPDVDAPAGFATGGQAAMPETSGIHDAPVVAPVSDPVDAHAAPYASGLPQLSAVSQEVAAASAAGHDEEASCGGEDDDAQTWPPFTPDVLAALCTVEVQGSPRATAAAMDGEGDAHFFEEGEGQPSGSEDHEAVYGGRDEGCGDPASTETIAGVRANAPGKVIGADTPSVGDDSYLANLAGEASEDSASDDAFMTAASAPAATPDVDAAPIHLHPLTVLGLGVGDTALSPVHETLLRDAEVLVGGRRQLAAFRGHPARQVVIASPVTDALETAARLREEGRRVVVLADGDPLFFGIGTRVARDFGLGAVRVVPSVSCLQAAAARLGMAWHDTVTVSMHGRDDWRPLAAAVLGGGPVCVLTDGVNTPDRIARHLLDRGVDWFRAHVFEDMGTVDEQAHDLSLAACAALDFGPCCTVLLVPRGDVRGPRTGMPDAFFAAEAGLLTKWPVRAVALAALRVNPADTVWDVGAGSGAMSVECAAVASRGSVWAVERDAARVVCVEENRRRMGAANIEVVHGDAPECLASLPTPDRVFMGGGLGGISADASCPVLRSVCQRLAPGGRVVVACVLLGSLERALGVFRSLGWPAEVVCVQASVSSPLAGDMRLAAFNPVHLVSAGRPRTGGQ